MLKKIAIKLILFYRGLLPFKRSLPHFFIAGTQKGGTTSLYSYLIQHPNVSRALLKEIHYFENPENRKRGKKWYLNHFPNERSLKRNNSITGEGTPFMYSYHVPQLVYELAPKAKIIFLLRDPVSRAFSHYYHNRRRLNREPLSFSEAVRSEEERISEDLEKNIIDPWYDDKNNRMYSYKSRGKYEEQLERWKKYFPENQLLVLKSETFFNDPQFILQKVTKFLNLPDFQFNVSYKANSGIYKDKIEEADKTFLKKQFKNSYLLLKELD